MTKPSKNQSDDGSDDAQFKKVVQHFLKTPPKPHDEKPKRKPKLKRKKER